MDWITGVWLVSGFLFYLPFIVIGLVLLFFFWPLFLAYIGFLIFGYIFIFSSLIKEEMDEKQEIQQIKKENKRIKNIDKNLVKEKEKKIIIGKKNEKKENKKFIPPAGTFDE